MHALWCCYSAQPEISYIELENPHSAGAATVQVGAAVASSLQLELSRKAVILPLMIMGENFKNSECPEGTGNVKQA